MRLRSALSTLSFRWQITLLGMLVFILFLAVLVATFAALSYTRSAVLSHEKGPLLETARTLAKEYADRVASAPHDETFLPDNLNNPSVRESLTRLSNDVLQKNDGAEGGFYSPAGNYLVGYSFPTSPNSASQMGQNDLPADLQLAILQVAQNATASGAPSEQVLTQGTGIVLIEAVPLRVKESLAGGTWAMKRLPTLPGTNRLRAYLIAVGLGITALACVTLTLLVVHNLQSGVRKIEGELARMEVDLTSQIPVDAEPDEIQRIARAVNRLGTALQENIDREKQVEAKLRHSERLAALGRLVAGVAHEIRNPLATIRLRVQMCQRTPSAAAVQDSCEVALEEVERLNGIVSRLLNFSQPVSLHTKITDLTRLAEQRLECFREKALDSRVRFVTSFTDEAHAVRVDEGRMGQVFDNVILNAIEAMSDSGGTLWVSLLNEPDPAEGTGMARIEFHDTGKGISTDVIQRIFDPFFTTKPSGIGLGLSICHELVRAHGGDIQVDSAEGRGTCITILLPLEAERMKSVSA